MAKSQTKDATNKSNALYNQAQSQTGQMMSGLGGRQAASTGFQTDTGSESKAGYEQQQTTGGYDPTQLSNILGGYGDFAKTGGMSDADKAAYMNQATSGVTGTYNVLADQLKRNAAATGGYGAGGDYSQLARQLSESQANATQQAQVGLTNLVNQNRLAGLGGLNTTESNVASGVNAANAGLGGLYGTSTGETLTQGQQMLNALGLQLGTQQGAIGNLTQLSRNPGLFGNIMQGLQSIPVSASYNIP